MVKASKRRGRHRIKRERAPLPGMLMHQDASTHRWLAGQVWDLVVTMHDATGEHTSMFFCGQEGTTSSFHRIGQTIARYGLFATAPSSTAGVSGSLINPSKISAAPPAGQFSVGSNILTERLARQGETVLLVHTAIRNGVDN